MSRRNLAIAAAALVVFVLLVVQVALSLDDYDEPERASEPPVTAADSPPPFVQVTPPVKGACKPPGPAAIDPATGKQLCGDDARRFVEGEQEKARRQLIPDESILRRGKRIIAKDPVMAPILRGRRYKFAKSGPWTSGEGQNELLGIGVEIRLAEPADFTAVLPYVCLGNPARGRGRLRWTVRDVTLVHANAEFATGRVAEADPLDLGTEGQILSVVRLPGSPKCPPSESD